VARTRRLLAETARALQDLHVGQTALHGYGRPGAHLTSAAVVEHEC
jgi:hypothetical protein